MSTFESQSEFITTTYFSVWLQTVFLRLFFVVWIAFSVVFIIVDFLLCVCLCVCVWLWKDILLWTNFNINVKSWLLFFFSHESFINNNHKISFESAVGHVVCSSSIHIFFFHHSFHFHPLLNFIHIIFPHFFGKIFLLLLLFAQHFVGIQRIPLASLQYI